MNDKVEKTFDELFPLIKNENQKLFLQLFPSYRVPQQVTNHIGISHSTFWTWLARDKLFAATYNALKKETAEHLILLHEKNIDEVALGAKTPAQSRIFGSLVRLRAEAPDKYREKVEGIKLPGEITVRLAMPSYAEMKSAKENLRLEAERKQLTAGEEPST